jgi:hypothetical protein
MEAMRVARAAWREKNREKIRGYNKRDYERNRREGLSRRRKTDHVYNKGRVLSKYGLTLEKRDALLAAQGNMCAVCGATKPGGPKGWHTDHDHAIGNTAVRGILCGRCNTTLGLIGDSLESVQQWSAKAIAYLAAARRRLTDTLAGVK